MLASFLSDTLFSCIVYFESLFLYHHRFENIRMEILMQTDNNFLLIKR
jgi:hypothetical protein